MKLEGKIDELLDMIIDGNTFRQMAAKHEVSISTVHTFLTLPEHAARTGAALALSAAQYADKAEEVLLDAVGTKEELSRAKELAQHYRWKAAKRDPKKYGEKLDLTSGDKPISGPAIFQIIPASQRPGAVDVTADE